MRTQFMQPSQRQCSAPHSMPNLGEVNEVYVQRIDRMCSCDANIGKRIFKIQAAEWFEYEPFRMFVHCFPMVEWDVSAACAEHGGPFREPYPTLEMWFQGSCANLVPRWPVRSVETTGCPRSGEGSTDLGNSEAAYFDQIEPSR
jgi:hypothetical protein